MRFAAFASFLFLIVGCQNAPVPPAPDGGTDPTSCNAFDKTAHASASGAIVGGVFPTLIGGRPVQPGEFPASPVIRAGNAACTANIIGPRTVLSAAHCMRDGGTISFSVEQNQYSATCEHHKEYSQAAYENAVATLRDVMKKTKAAKGAEFVEFQVDATADWALCYTNRDVSVPKFESVLVDPHPAIALGNAILKGGFGCTQPGGSGGNDNVYRIGEATIRQLPSNSSYDLISVGSGNCFGDSGGPAWLVLADGKRFQVAVTSRGDIVKTNYDSATFVPEFKSFLTDWTQRKNTKVCGLHADAPNCRNGSPQPEADTKFVVQVKNACVEGRVSRAKIADKADAKERVRKSLETF